MLNPIISMSNDAFYEKLSMEIIHSPSIYFNSIQVLAEKNSILENVDLSVYYNLSERFEIGLSYKIEQYYLKYTKSVDYDIYDVHNHISMQNINSHFRYYFLEFMEKGQLFGKISIGGNQYGLILREGIGIKYQPLIHGYIIASCMVNHFYYNSENTGFLSNKLSFNYGIGVNF